CRGKKKAMRAQVARKLTEAVIFGLLCFFGMLIFRFPYPTATSAVVGVMAVIPVFGAWIGAILGALLCLSDSLTRALLFVLFFIILQQLENNLIYPRVVGKSLGLPGMLVFISVILGSSFGGVLGILLAVPLCSVVFVLTKEGIENRLNKKKAINNIADIRTSPDNKHKK
ncbi:MAG: AI-2E family transporter, partial [Oscillospiraceae bacterium]